MNFPRCWAGLVGLPITIGEWFILLPEIGLSYDDESEELMALELLESDVDPVHVQYSEEDTLEQILADICSGSVSSTSELSKMYKGMNIPVDALNGLSTIESYGFVLEDHGDIRSTDYGKAVSMSFLQSEEAEYIKRHLEKEI